MSALTCNACKGTIHYDQFIAVDEEISPIHKDCPNPDDVKDTSIVTAVAQRSIPELNLGAQDNTSRTITNL